jgi:hypothetical protein
MQLRELKRLERLAAARAAESMRAAVRDKVRQLQQMVNQLQI